MGSLTIPALRVVLAVLLAGSVFVQTVMMALVAADLEQVDPSLQYLRIPLIVIGVLGTGSAEVVLVCMWRLVTMVQRNTVFSDAAFRFVDVITGAIVAAAILIFALAALLASANHRVEGDAVAPGLVGLICGVVVAVLGVALLVRVLRMLLAQAIARDDEAARMRRELDEVI